MNLRIEVLKEIFEHFDSNNFIGVLDFEEMKLKVDVDHNVLFQFLD